MTIEHTRYLGTPAWTIELAVALLMNKKEIKMKTGEKAKIMASLASAVGKRPAASTQPPLPKWASHKWSLPEIVTFGTPAITGKMRHVVRKSDGRFRMNLSQKGSKRISSNWHKSKQEAFDLILNKIAEHKTPGKEPTGNAPARSQHTCDVLGVIFVHQIFGLYRDGAEMPPLFKLSSEAWQAYCCRQRCTYILWTAEMIDTVMQKYAPHTILLLYKEVRYLVQQVDIARFFLLYMYGGLYADLDVFPNRDMYPQVTFGLCKMPHRAKNQQDEWEMEVVIATSGNPNILKLLEHMHISTGEKDTMSYYWKKPCRYIYYTTGPKSVRKFFKHTPLEHSVTFFTMCRPIEQPKLVLNATGIIAGFPPTLKKYDVLSTFSMSYQGQARAEGITLFSPLAKLPPFPKVVYRRLKRKAPCHLIPWKAETPEKHSISQDLVRQPGEVKNNHWAVAVESDSSDDSQGIGYQLLSGYTEKQEAERALRATKGLEKPRKRSKRDRYSTTPEAIGRLISGCS
jgi:hypothetical protein